jgi:1-acyl-sn-glycerol-3-phosphate acyltransferase
MKKPLNSFYGVVIRAIRFVWRVVYPYEVSGVETLPQERTLLCPNHASNLDPIYIAVALPNNYLLHFMAKEELFRNSALGWLLRKLGAFPVSRGNSDIQAVKTAIQVLKDNDNLMIFPEGTVIRNGIGKNDGLPARAKSGAAMIGIRTGAKLVPVFVDGEKKPFRKVRVIFGEPYEPVYSGRHGTAEELQKIADDILAQAYALGGQAVGGTPLCEK